MFRKKLKDEFTTNRPGSVTPLAILTGATLLILSPVTIPSISNAYNKALNKSLSRSNDRISNEISDVLTNRTLYYQEKKSFSKEYETKYNNDIQKLLLKYPSEKIDHKKWLFIISIEDYSDTDNVLYAKRSAEMFEKVAQKTLGISNRNT